MNPITTFLVRNMVAVFFFYGLAFFSMGLALILAGRRASQFRFAQAIRPLAWFGIVHGLHEWFEMFQQIATLTTGHLPTVPEELARLALLSSSFLMLSTFGILLLLPGRIHWRRAVMPVVILAGLWIASTVLAALVLDTPSVEEAIILGDVLARYILAIPGALLATWALLVQQRTFREHGMPQFGRDLVWCAAALLLYGVVGQLFVRPSPLASSTLLNSTAFLNWFGIPVQLFRAIMATVLALFMVRALNAFELESQRQLDEAHEERLKAQTAALDAERRAGREMERLNEELRLATHELALLLELSNLLAEPTTLPDRLHGALEKLVGSLTFPDTGAILLVSRQTGVLQERASVGLAADEPDNREIAAILALGQRCVDTGLAVCLHADGSLVEFLPDEIADREKCKRRGRTVITLALPLITQQRVIGSLVLHQTAANGRHDLTRDEFTLALGAAQQLGLSIENARLHQEAQEREKRLGELLHQAVNAQEAERQRIARELHDATGQSLTAVALGLQGVEKLLAIDQPAALEQIPELITFSTTALGELRQIIADLRPSQLDDLGLVAALEWYVNEFKKRTGILAELTISGERGPMATEFETVLFRITQEALTNVAKHAQATRATVSLAIDEAKACLTIQDDGRGFDTEEALRPERLQGWGLLGIRERALLLNGKCEIASAVGRGTLVRVTVPLAMEVEHGQGPSVAG